MERLAASESECWASYGSLCFAEQVTVRCFWRVEPLQPGHRWSYSDCSHTHTRIFILFIVILSNWCEAVKCESCIKQIRWHSRHVFLFRSSWVLSIYVSVRLAVGHYYPRNNPLYLQTAGPREVVLHVCPCTCRSGVWRGRIAERLVATRANARGAISWRRRQCRGLEVIKHDVGCALRARVLHVHLYWVVPRSQRLSRVIARIVSLSLSLFPRFFFFPFSLLHSPALIMFSFLFLSLSPLSLYE